jgi:hypothetical protein
VLSATTAASRSGPHWVSRSAADLLHAQIGHFPDEDIRKLTWENAAKLFQHPVPEALRTDPDAY